MRISNIWLLRSLLGLFATIMFSFESGAVAQFELYSGSLITILIHRYQNSFSAFSINLNLLNKHNQKAIASTKKKINYIHFLNDG